MVFVDECTVFARAGRGGQGSASMHSEPFKPRGGPDGGNGGEGGSVIFEVSRSVHDLSRLADHPHLVASSGQPGRKGKRDGAAGTDLVIQVPDGTVVFDEQGLLADLVGEGARGVVARGGRGGRGNVAFVSGRNRVPRTAEPGEVGEDKRLQVELRTVADVGLVGLPNAGKSTLLARISAAKPKIAEYPFTTLTPNLGVAGEGEDRFVIADIPGLIEGASMGRGLGHRFLRHIVRCRTLIYVIDLAAPDPAADLATLRAELAAYDPALADRPAIVVGAKADLVDDAAIAASLGDDVIALSAMTGEGVDELLERTSALTRGGEATGPERRAHVVLRPGRPRFTVERGSDGRWRVTGRSVERWVLETDLDDEGAVTALQGRIRREGIERKLASLGARAGDEVVILDRVFEYVPDDEISSERGAG
ncbi:MAG TPA: GTPase ObgE [Actinomycetota bacterium]|nr:GTPase ObgE [Actinomycetota bacterium]